jgi:hypothetical protein
VLTAATVTRDVVDSVVYYLAALAGCVVVAGALRELAAEQRRIGAVS